MLVSGEKGWAVGLFLDGAPDPDPERCKTELRIWARHNGVDLTTSVYTLWEDGPGRPQAGQPYELKSTGPGNCLAAEKRRPSPSPAVPESDKYMTLDEARRYLPHSDAGDVLELVKASVDSVDVKRTWKTEGDYGWTTYRVSRSGEVETLEIWSYYYDVVMGNRYTTEGWESW